MSVKDDISYKWVRDNGQISVTRTIIADIGASLDLAIPNGSANLPASFAFSLSTLKSLFASCDQAITLVSGGTNAVQRITITGTPTGGTFTVTKGASTSAAIARNATAADVQTALRAMASIGANGVVCTGGPLPGSTIDCQFVGTNAVAPVATMTTTDSLTGGTAPASAITSITTGVTPDTTLAIKANVPLLWDSQGYFANPFAADVITLRATNASGVDASLKMRTLSSAS